MNIDHNQNPIYEKRSKDARPCVSPLPIYEKRDQILHALRFNQVTIVAGETGSGKTTQLPLLCLEAGLGKKRMIGCTQPRRIAALSLARYVGESFGDAQSAIVGYKIRFDEKLSAETKIKFMTDGILLAEIAHDPLLNQYDTIIIDEAHERSVNIDFLLGYLRTLLPQRPDLRLVISSATIDTKLFSRSFHHAPVITVSGRMFPVEIRYKPVIERWKGQSMDSCIDGVLLSIQEIFDSKETGDILVFLPTIDDIIETSNRLGHLYNDCCIQPLHSRMPATMQQQIFKSSDRRKIVIATNIAETSITVPGIRYVIDSGLARILSYESSVGFSRMPIQRISKASADQRAGRCGRVSDGICIRLYSEQDYLSRPSYTTPEIRRINLAGVILRMLHLGLGDASKFPFLQHPLSKSIVDGYNQLKELYAIDKVRKITPLGKRMALLPLDPPVSRMVMYAWDHGALSELLIISSALSVDNVFGHQEEKSHRFRRKESDFMSFLSLWSAFFGTLEKRPFTSSELHFFCLEYGLSPLKLREWFDAHEQIERICKSIPGYVFRYRMGAPYDVIHKCLLAGMMNGVAFRVDKCVYQGVHSSEIRPFPGSVLFGKDYPWVLFHEIVETGKVYGRMAATIHPKWIEEMFRRECRYSWTSPRFDPKTGTVLANEEVLFHGLKLISNRVVDLSKKDRKAAHNVFICEALVKEQAGVRFRFLSENRKTRDNIRIIEQKARTELYAGDQILQALYEEKLDGICTVQELYKCISSQDNDSFLIFSPLELIITDVLPTTENTPDTIFIGDQCFPVTYSFAPGSEGDGATITIDEDAYCTLPVYFWEWLLPVYWKDRVSLFAERTISLIKNKHIICETVVDSLLSSLSVPSGPFLQVLCTNALELFGITVDSSEVAMLIPEYLWPRIIVKDNKNVNKKVFRASQNAISDYNRVPGIRPEFIASSCKEFERDFGGEWGIGMLQAVPVRSQKQILPLIVFPAFRSDNNGVVIRAYLSLSAACQSHINVIRAMIEEQMAEKLAWEIEMIKIPMLLEQKFNKLLGSFNIYDVCIRMIIEKVLKLPSDLPCCEIEFSTLLEDAANRVDGAALEVVNLIDKCISGIEMCQNLLQKRIRRHGASTNPLIIEELQSNLDSYIKLLSFESAQIELLQNSPKCLDGLIKRIDIGFLEPHKWKSIRYDS